MKLHSILTGFLGTMLAAGIAVAGSAGQARNLGLGVELGSPTGVTGKYWLDDTQALDGTVGWSVGHRNDFQIQSDYLWHFNTRYLGVKDARVPLYVGAGLRITGGDGATAGFRFPIGMDYLLNTAPVEFFVELAPVFRFASSVAGDLDGAVGARYYFNIK